MNKVHARSKRGKRPARKAPKPGTTATDRRLLATAERENAEGAIPPGPAVFARQQLRGVPPKEALRYLDTVLEHAEECVIKSLPKLLVDITRRQYPAFSAINAIEVVREGLRLVGGAQ